MTKREAQIKVWKEAQAAAPQGKTICFRCHQPVAYQDLIHLKGSLPAHANC